MSRFLNVFPIWLVQSSASFSLVSVEMSFFADRKMRLLTLTLNVELVILVILSLILWSFHCCSHPSTETGDTTGKTLEKQGSRKSAMVKERSNRNGKSFLQVAKITLLFLVCIFIILKTVSVTLQVLG